MDKKKPVCRRMLFMIFCLFLVLMAGCVKDKAGEEEKTEYAGRTDADAKEDVTITWWTFPVLGQQKGEEGTGTYENKLIAAFEKEHPDIHVKVEYIDFSTGPDKISLAIKNGTICDVLLDAPGRIIEYGKNGELVKLDDLFAEDYLSDMVNAQLLKACTDGEDHYYMYPLSAAPFYMAFNKSCLEKAGVANLVKEGWTTEDFKKVLQALQAEGYVPGSLFCSDQGGDQATRALISNLYSGNIVDGELSEYTINDASGKKGFSFVEKAVADGLILNGTLYNGSEDIVRFASGQSSFTFLWSPSQQNSNQALLNINHIETVEVPFPSEDGVPELEYLVNGFAVFDHHDDKKAQAAKEFIKFVCDDAKWGKRSVISSGCFPIRKSFGTLYEEERMKTIGNWSEYYGNYYNTIDGFGQMRSLWYTAMQNLVNGVEKPEEVAEEFVTAANQTRKRQE